MLEKAILAPHVRKRLIEPGRSRPGGARRALGPGGSAVTGAPLIVDAGRTAGWFASLPSGAGG